MTKVKVVGNLKFELWLIRKEGKRREKMCIIS